MRLELYANLRAAEKGAWLSIGTYLFFSTTKLFFGFVGMSTALKADGLNNLTDIISSVAVLIGLRIAQKPPDAVHRYGHLRAETIASVVASFIMLVVGLEVLSNSIHRLLTPIEQAPSFSTAIVAMLCAAIMYVVYRYNLALANKHNSSALRATAYDNRSDTLVSIGTAAGITFSIIGLPILDVITASLVGLLIIKTAIEIFWESVQTLTDAFNVEEAKELKQCIANVEGVRAVKDIKGRLHGHIRYIDVTVNLHGALTVHEAHLISGKIEAAVRDMTPNSFVFVHIEPHSTR